ncbi:hypothetical protein CWE08_04905 [Aliidiomarina iranensis]|uniref:Anti-sigma-E factor RseA n=1 Tax=Aliidiomarina iranensis TaxID=1434071 RepID=A0A432W0G9_9GAMM|nr:RseA family anti-sigma factor [Aliidiomarina iranensis]RUO22519.1 hypothetical protein CWE08_04905 [Aliidiomarina iranensis]
MTEHQKEQLSALLDGHFDGDEAVHELVENASQRERWFRYQLTGAVIRGEAISGQPFDISASVAAQIAAEPKHAAAPKSAWQNVQQWLQRGWFRPAANVAVAAGVAIVTVVGIQNYQPVADGVAIPDAGTGAAVNQGFETRPLGGVINPVSFNMTNTAVVDQQEADNERRLLQSFFFDHQQQLQLNEQELSEERIGEQASSEQEQRNNSTQPDTQEQGID